MVGGVAVREAEVGLTGGADARHQLVLLALLPVLHSMAAVLEHLLLLVLLRAALVYVSRDCQVRNCTSCNGNWGRTEWTNWHLKSWVKLISSLAGWQVGRQTLYLDILLVLSGTGVIIIQEVVLAKKTRAGIAPDEALLPLPSAFELNTILKTNSNSYVCFQVLAPEIF